MAAFEGGAQAPVQRPECQAASTDTAHWDRRRQTGIQIAEVGVPTC